MHTIPHTLTRVAKLSAHNSGIRTAPSIITNSTPGTTNAHFHTTLQIVATSHQSHISSSAAT